MYLYEKLNEDKCLNVWLVYLIARIASEKQDIKTLLDSYQFSKYV